MECKGVRGATKKRAHKPQDDNGFCVTGQYIGAVSPSKVGLQVRKTINAGESLGTMMDDAKRLNFRAAQTSGIKGTVCTVGQALGVRERVERARQRDVVGS